ncbi:hypothetical protein BDV12DRAFT_196596 [Aspergillus spectabilis]
MSTTPKLENLMARSIMIYTHPAPRNLPESRLVLAQLQKFGEVVAFRNLRYDQTNKSTAKYSAILALFENPSSVQAALQASPLAVPMPLLSSSPTSSPSNQSPESNTNTNTCPDTPTPDSHPQEPQTQRTITCEIRPNQNNHYATLHRNPFFGQFSPDNSSPIARDLYRKLAIDMKALADTPLARKEYSDTTKRRATMRGIMRMGGGSLMALYREGVKMAERAEVKEQEEKVVVEGEKKKDG